MVETGQKAPDFSLYNTGKTKVSLDDFKGKTVVLLFFPLAFSRVCTAELCGIRDEMAAYNNQNAVVLGISVDSLYTLAKFREDQHLNFELLSDFNKEVSARYDALYENFSYDMKGVSRRAAFVIDGDGILRHKEILENPGEIPDFKAVQKVISEVAVTIVKNKVNN
jgi:glutaredoxin-dependent peroxiredoxin